MGDPFNTIPSQQGNKQPNKAKGPFRQIQIIIFDEKGKGNRNILLAKP